MFLNAIGFKEEKKVPELLVFNSFNVARTKERGDGLASAIMSRTRSWFNKVLIIERHLPLV